MSNKALKITIGGLIILGGYIGAYQSGYVCGVLACKKVINEPYQKKSEHPKRWYNVYYHRSTKPRNDVYILNSREDAINLLKDLRYLLSRYGKVTVNDYKNLMGIENGLGDNERGWTDLSGAEIVGSLGGWTVVLPGPKDLY